MCLMIPHLHGISHIAINGKIGDDNKNQCTIRTSFMHVVEPACSLTA
jgi:hypothetical protein